MGWEAAAAADAAGRSADFLTNLFWQGRLENREDTAIQRRAADMRAAGINPLLAAGQPAQANTVQRDMGGTPADEMTALADLATAKAQARNLTAQADQQEERTRIWKETGMDPDNPHAGMFAAWKQMAEYEREAFMKYWKTITNAGGGSIGVGPFRIEGHGSTGR